MNYSPSFSYPVAGHMPTVVVQDGSTQPDFGSRSGSVSTQDSCAESEGLAKDAVQANLDVLDTITKANVDQATMEKIFGQDQFQSRRGKSCSWSQVISCGSSVTKAIQKCIGGGLNIDSIFTCVEGFLGAGNSCMGCVCRFLGIVTGGKVSC